MFICLGHNSYNFEDEQKIDKKHQHVNMVIILEDRKHRRQIHCL